MFLSLWSPLGDEVPPRLLWTFSMLIGKVFWRHWKLKKFDTIHVRNKPLISWTTYRCIYRKLIISSLPKLGQVTAAKVTYFQYWSNAVCLSVYPTRSLYLLSLFLFLSLPFHLLYSPLCLRISVYLSCVPPARALAVSLRISRYYSLTLILLNIT